MRVAVVIAGLVAGFLGATPHAAAARQLTPDVNGVVQDGHIAAGSHRVVRSTDPTIAALVTDACTRSPFFRRLVTEIRDTAGIVYIQSGSCPIGGMRGCLLHNVLDAGGTRYLWVHLRPGDSALDSAATIAHELQHAAEILARPEIKTNLDIVRFYASPEARDLGPRRGTASLRSYETTAAITAGEIVRAELMAGGRLDGAVAGCSEATVLADDEH